MIYLPQPVNGTPVQQAAVCFAEIWQEMQGSSYAVLLSSSPSIRITWESQVSAYVHGNGAPAATGPSPFPRSPQRTGTAGDVMFARYDAKNPGREAILSHASRVKGAFCPYCGLYMRRKPHHRSPDRDHVRPRSLFPEFSLLRLNLVVVCDDCNDAKSNHDVDPTTGEWRFLHPYFDHFLRMAVLEADVVVSNCTLAVTFRVAGGLPQAAARRIELHEEALDLFHRYGDEPIREVLTVLGVHKQWYQTQTPDEQFVRRALMDEGTLRLSERPNDPVGLIMCGLSRATDLADLLT